MISDTDYILIDKYLNNELSTQEVQDFENRLATDEQLAKELELVKDMHHFGKNRSGANEMLDVVAEMGKKYAPQKDAQVIPIYKRRKVIWAGVVAMASIFLLLIFSDLFTSDPYQEFFQHQKISGEQGSSEENLKRAIKDFNQKKYKSALDAFKTIDNFSNAEYELAKGICHLELNQFQAAHQIFSNLQQSQQTYKNTANWYLALTALKEKKYANCRQLLSEIDSDSAYAQKAEKLLNIIKSK